MPFQIVKAVLKHPNYPDSSGTAVLINSTSEKQQLSAVGLWTVMAKIKELTEDLWLWIVAAHKSGKGYKAISKCFQVPVATRQSIIKKIQDVPHCGKCDTYAGQEDSERGEEESKVHPGESGHCWW